MEQEINEFVICCRYIESLNILKSKGFDVNTYNDKIIITGNNKDILREFFSVSDLYFYAIGYEDRDFK
mgnify:CR=1 FL=1